MQVNRMFNSTKSIGLNCMVLYLLELNQEVPDLLGWSKLLGNINSMGVNFCTETGVSI